MEKKIFISHSSLDTEIGEKFVDVLIEIGIPKEIIFYSSRYHTGVEIGNDFHAEIKQYLSSCDIVVFLLTKNFYNSPACLNEMGAAWILDKDISPILLDNLKPSDMKGFIDSHYIAFTPKPGEEYKLISKLNPYITKRNTQRELQEIFADFINAANDISKYSEQYTGLYNADLSFLEEEIIKKRFTDVEILVLEYFKESQNNYLELNNTNFDEFVQSHSNFEYQNAFCLLVESEYISAFEKRLDDGTIVYSYYLKLDYFRQLISIGSLGEKYIESVKSKYKKINSDMRKVVFDTSNVLDTYIADGNIRELELLLLSYVYDKMDTSLGDRWMANGTIASIQAWEREEFVNDKLSRNYHTALNILINKGVLEVVSYTSYGNPREYKFKDEYAKGLNSLNEQSKELMTLTKKNNYQVYSDDDLPF